MQKLFNLLFLVSLSLSAQSQITVTNSTFPEVGDTLNLAIQTNPDIQMGIPGGPFVWDYTNLDAQLEQQLVFRPASEGTLNVPGASLFAAIPGGIENYYSSSPNAFFLIAVKGPVGQVFGVESTFKYNPPRQERKAPLHYLDVYTSTSNLLIPFSTENIPSAIIDSLGLPVVPDSIRLRIASQLTDEVDAYGMVRLPHGDFNALRVKRTEAINTRVDVLLPFFGWQDVTDVLISGGLIPGLGNDTRHSYLFFSDTEKEVLVEASMDSTGQNVQQVIFKNDDPVSAVDEHATGVSTPIECFPNPFSASLYLKANPEISSHLEVDLFTPEGKLLQRISLAPGETKTLGPAEFQNAPSSYFFQVLDGSGKIVQRGKLIKQ